MLERQGDPIGQLLDVFERLLEALGDFLENK
jgi:hypothetical protein